MRSAILGRTGIETSAIGLGMEHLEKAAAEDVAAVVEPALEAGVRYMDVFMPTPGIRDIMGSLMKGRRERFQIQGHLGACLKDGQYFRTRDPRMAEAHAEDLLRRLGTDYVDTLMVHFVDEPAEWEEVSAPGGTLEIALRWKAEGRARAVGLSSHKVGAALAAVSGGLVDILMFPVNPSFDILPGDTKLEAHWEAGPYDGLRKDGSKASDARRALFLECERRGVAIVAMKPYAAGWAFWKDNPSGISMTPTQCLEYALSRPGVAVAVPGCKTAAELEAALAWVDATDEEKDCGPVLGATGWRLSGACMYCNHCLPCPAGIDVAATARLADAARGAGPGGGPAAALKDAYGRLPAPASACLECGDCEERCPFGVRVRDNMKRAAAVFGS